MRGNHFWRYQRNINEYYHIVKIIEEENQTTYYAEEDSEPHEPRFSGPRQITYIFRKEPELSDSYEEAVKYFEGIRELRIFESYQTADDNKIRVLYKAMGRGEEKAYYLVGVNGEDGLYFIETEDIVLDNRLQVLYGRSSSLVEEYCYILYDIKCGGHYTETVQRAIYASG